MEKTAAELDQAHLATIQVCPLPSLLLRGEMGPELPPDLGLGAAENTSKMDGEVLPLFKGCVHKLN